MAFKDYLGLFTKLFLDDFNAFNHLDTHLAKLCLCFKNVDNLVLA